MVARKQRKNLQVIVRGFNTFSVGIGKKAAYQFDQDGRVIARICASCKQSKSIDQFAIWRRADGSVHFKAECNECKAETNKRYRENNLEKEKSRCRAYYHENKAIRNKASNDYRAKNVEIAKARVICYRRALTAQRYGATVVDLTPEEWLAIKAAAESHCAICGKRSDALEMDHIIPLSRGGNHTASNVQAACHECNWTKSNRLEGETKPGYTWLMTLLEKQLGCDLPRYYSDARAKEQSFGAIGAAIGISGETVKNHCQRLGIEF